MRNRAFRRRVPQRLIVAAGLLTLVVSAGCKDSGPSATSASPNTVPTASAGTSVPSVIPASTVKSTTPAPANGGTKSPTATFCADAKNLADLNGKTQKDLASGVNIAANDYAKKLAEATLPLLLGMKTDAPSAISATASEFVAAYSNFVSARAGAGWAIPPKDPAQRAALEAAIAVYGPIASADLPKLDSFVTKTCGFPLNILTGVP